MHVVVVFAAVAVLRDPVSRVVRNGGGGGRVSPCKSSKDTGRRDDRRKSARERLSQVISGIFFMIHEH